MPSQIKRKASVKQSNNAVAALKKQKLATKQPEKEEQDDIVEAGSEEMEFVDDEEQEVVDSLFADEQEEEEDEEEEGVENDDGEELDEDEAEEGDLEGLEELEVDDEFDDEENEDEEENDDDDDEEEEDDSDDFDDLRKNKKQNNQKRFERGTEDGLADTISKLLSRDLPQKDEKKPILANKKHIGQTIDDSKLEAKARRQVNAQKKEKLEKDHIKPAIETENWNFEKNLRKIATRGVVKLFNAIKAAQRGADEAKKESATNAGKVVQVSKSNFLDMLKAQDKSKSKSAATSTAAKSTTSSQPGWSALKDDFAMSSKSLKFKDYSKDNDEFGSGVNEEEMGFETGKGIGLEDSDDE